MKTRTIYYFTTLVLLVMVPISLFSQIHVIKGTVKDGPAGAPVPGAVVTILETGLSDVTDAQGEYSIPTDTGVYRTVSVGYEAKYFLTVPGTNWMNFWSNPPDLPSDFDNNYYQTVVIGDQTWMKENLKATHYSNADPISYNPEQTTWGPPPIGAYYIYDENEANVEEYGMLYNWYAVEDSRNVCPSGWHVPTYPDYQALFISLGYNPEVMEPPPMGGYLKEAGFAHWASPNTGATDDFGFTALPGGEYSEGVFPSAWEFRDLGIRGSFWCGTDLGGFPGPAEVRAMQMTYNSADITFDAYSQSNGFSVRCIMDATPPSVNTYSVTNITGTSATSGGVVTSEGSAPVTVAGVCWSTGPDPDLSDNVSVDGSGLGSFSSQLTPLTPNTTYYVRAYATNASGTAYGDQVSFTTTCPEILLTETVTHITCFGSNDGSVSVTATGGTAPYTFVWDHGPTTPIISSLSPGTYSVTVTDSNGCTGQGSYVVSEPAILAVSGLVTDVSCYGLSDGSIDITISGGTPPFAYAWNNGATTEDISALATGTYTITVTDANGCQQIVPYTVSEPAPLQVTLDNVNIETCTGCSDGSINITVTGGTLPYSFLWSNGTSDEDAAGLAAGVYDVTAEDLNGCTAVLSAEVFNPLMVTNTDDSGMGSLRNAIIYANDNNPNITDSIIFNIPGDGPHVIRPLTEFNTIDQPLIIDGFSQTGALPNTNPPGQGFNSVMKIVIDGTNFFPDIGATGLIVNADNCKIRGLVFSYFPFSGIRLQENQGNLVEGNFFGTDPAGSTTPGSGIETFGIEVWRSDNNIIRGNLVSGNGGGEHNPGIIIDDGSTNNLVTGNLIGTDITGTSAFPNGGSGIVIGESPNNVIGGLDAKDRNIIFGGIEIGDSEENANASTGNQIIGNYIGPDVSGDNALGAGAGIVVGGIAANNIIGPENVISGIGSGNAILLGEGTSNTHVRGNIFGLKASESEVLPNGTTNIVIERSHDNIIGGPTPEESNRICGTLSEYGIQIKGELSTGNIVIGNYVGTNAAGDPGLGNARDGIVINDSASNNFISGGNVISGNGFFGISIHGQQTTGNQVVDNLIGTDPSGTTLLSNADDGVNIGEASFNVISGNVLCGAGIGHGTGNNGIEILGATASNNTVSGNYIGTNTLSASGLGNGFNGVQIKRDAHDNTIGPDNVISGNWGHGVVIEGDPPDGTSADNNIVYGNYIGTSSDGLSELGNNWSGVMVTDNASGNTIGPDNVISDNNQTGVQIQGAGSTGNRIIGNYIGLSASGYDPMLNGEYDIRISDSPGNFIGGTDPGEGNLIVRMEMVGIESQNNQIAGNFIGLNKDGDAPIIPDSDFTSLILGDAHHNIIGPGNVISGNREGISINLSEGLDPMYASGNWIRGNFIGTSADGLSFVGHRENGIVLSNTSGTIIGGINEEDRNTISGNGYGINISGDDADNNIVIGNYLGIDTLGVNSIDNDYAIWLSDGDFNVIGGSTPDSANVISGNQYGGIVITSAEDNATGNRIQGNLMGPQSNGTALPLSDDPLNMIQTGILISHASGNLIGGPEEGQRNVISGNGSVDSLRHGIQIEFVDSEDEGNTVQGNYVGTDISGQAGLGNKFVGILIYHAANTMILDNVVSDNLTGICIFEGDPPAEDIRAENNIIRGNLVGVTADGADTIGNKYGILLQRVQNNFIGGTSPEDANIIGGNYGFGVYITGSSTENNYVIGNFIGVDRSGKLPLPNGQGVNVDDNATMNYIGTAATGGGNVIAHNAGPGIGLGGIEDFVENNKIYGNDGRGILITGHHHTVGGNLLTQRNYIYGNGDGIGIFPEATFNTISRNYIGTDRNGEKDLTEAWNGVAVGGCDNSVIGNLIVGYEHHGVFLNRWHSPEDPNPNPIPERNRVEGNYIGLNSTGTSFIPNGHGITVDAATNNILIKNTIAGNNFDGISIANSIEPVSVNNLVSQNRIYGNGGIGIDLGLDGITDNDEDDSDAGTNQLQNYPVIDSINFPPGQVTVRGYLNSTPDDTFCIEFFASRIEDQNSDPAHGEGETYIGSDTVVTDETGMVWFEKTFSVMGSSGQVITATASDLTGNTSEFSMAMGGIRDEILADFNMPFHYRINEDGVPNIVDGSDTAAIVAAFNSWMDIPTADLEFVLDGLTPETNASATDGINLVTFRDERFPMPPGVLAIAAKTLRVRPDDQVAEILDADMVFNPDYVNGDTYKFGIWQTEADTLDVFDVQSVTGHELGHVLGLRHTGAPRATMFFALGTDTINRSLEPDDMAWASYRYPNGLFASSYSYISGTITYGDLDDQPPVAGALVLAVDTSTKDMFHAYSDQNGDYRIPVPVAPADPTYYWILIQPLDGDVFGFNMRPGNISSYVYSHTIYTDYPMEWYDELEGIDDDPADGVEIPVMALADVTGINLITNKDIIPPVVLDVMIAGEEIDSVAIRPDIRIKFSEPVEKASFTDQTCFLTLSQDTIAGSYTQFGDSTHIFVFRPDESLNYETEYTLHVLEISDRKENLMTGEYLSSFTTREPDLETPYVEGTIPQHEQDSVFVRDSIMIFFSKAMKKSSVFNGFTLSFDEDPDVSGTFDLDPFNKVLTFIPLNTMNEATDYTITLAYDIEDLSGNTLGEDEEDDLIYEFSTVDVSAPEVIYLGPLADEDSVTVETPVVVDFSEPIDMNTISNVTFSLTQGNNPPVTGEFEYLLNDSRVVFRPDQLLGYNLDYTINLTGGENGIYDISLPYPQYFDVLGLTSTFTTAEAPVQPFLEYLSPWTGTEGATVTIIGEGFDPDPLNNKVFFAGSEAEVLSSSLHQLVTSVPSGAITGGVTVEVKGTESINSQYFFIIPQSLDPCSDDEGNILSGSGSRSVAVSPNTGYAYVTNYDSESVSVLNLDDNSPEDPIMVEKAPLKIDLNPTGTRAYVTNHLSHSVSVIDTDPGSSNFNKQIKVIPVGAGPYGVAASADKKLYVANHYSENISVIDVDPNSGGFNHVIANLQTGSRNRDVAVTGNSGIILVTGDDGLCILEFTPGGDYSDVSVTRVNSGTGTRGVTVIPNTGLAVVTTEDGNMFIAGILPGINLGDMVAYVNTGSRARDVSASGDALFVYVTMTNPDEVAVYNLEFGSLGLPNASYFTDISLSLHHTIPLDGGPKALAIDERSEKLVVMQTTDKITEDELKEVKICCGPIPPEKSVGDLIINIQNLARSGIIDHENGNLLISKLYTVLQHLEEDDPKGAINVLNTTIKKVDQMIKKGQIDPEVGRQMIDQLEAIIAEIEAGTKSIDLATGVAPLEIPDESALGSIYPNPFTNSTIIHYQVSGGESAAVHVRLRIYNGTGQVVRDLVDKSVTQGHYTVEWDGRYHDDRPASEGIYFIEFIANDILQVRKVVKIR